MCDHVVVAGDHAAIASSLSGYATSAGYVPGGRRRCPEEGC